MVSYKAVRFDGSDPDFIRCMGWEQNSEKAHWGPGFRPYYILHYVLSGEGELNGQPIHENQGFFMNNTDLYEYHSNPENPWTYFWMIFSENLAEKYVAPMLSVGGSNVFSFPFKYRLLKLCNEIFADPGTLSHLKALSCFFTVLSCHEQKNLPDHGSGRQYVELAKQYIDDHCNIGVSVGAVADALHIDDRYLYNLFVRYEGISVKAYMIQSILRASGELLRNTGLSVSEIASSVGFSDVCTFSRFFSAHTGISPTSARKRGII